jgi:hypothetical protein
VFAAYILSPLIALLPRGWRERVLGPRRLGLVPGAIVSGVVEAVLALYGLIVWYSIYVSTVGQAVATSSVPGAGNSRIGMYAYILFWLNPITWIVAYFAAEGAVRAVAALSTGEICGTLPFFLIERIARRLRRPKTNPPVIADEIQAGGKDCDMKIACCRARDEWTYPFTIRYAGAYFQIVASAYLGAGPRPYVYSLRRLPQGERAGGLKDYSPDAILTSKQA